MRSSPEVVGERARDGRARKGGGQLLHRNCTRPAPTHLAAQVAAAQDVVHLVGLEQLLELWGQVLRPVGDVEVADAQHQHHARRCRCCCCRCCCCCWLRLAALARALLLLLRALGAVRRPGICSGGAVGAAHARPLISCWRRLRESASASLKIAVWMRFVVLRLRGCANSCERPEEAWIDDLAH